jgi:hypothetical protein
MQDVPQYAAEPPHIEGRLIVYGGFNLIIPAAAGIKNKINL